MLYFSLPQYTTHDVLTSMYFIGFIDIDDICWPTEKQSQVKSLSSWIYQGFDNMQVSKVNPVKLPQSTGLWNYHLKLNKDREYMSVSGIQLQHVIKNFLSSEHFTCSHSWGIIKREVYKKLTTLSFSCKMKNKQQTVNAANSVAQKHLSFINGKSSMELPLVHY